MSYSQAEKVSTGGGKFAFKVTLCLAYAVACTVAERTIVPDGAQAEAGGIITAIVVAPLIVCGLMYAAWWRKADEFQKLIEYRSCAAGALGGVFFLVALKLASYFLTAIDHIPALGIVGMVLVYWVSNSHSLNVKALRS